jgi:hypothetical protein
MTFEHLKIFPIISPIRTKKKVKSIISILLTSLMQKLSIIQSKIESKKVQNIDLKKKKKFFAMTNTEFEN